ncbi:SpoIIE family protein phosphatase [Streptomyces poriferorum]|uniref:SpoIIE family protein phosphatase n=1 Tax=Streptomyces TaxID=1883 RepID=UPI001C5DC4FE|nr:MULTISPECIES: SpoIIE family protein phosphatase [Streptomyces]MBW5249937.1 SpoIIE family protein phosphatase [Streptomyces poriferorum]MBW5256927.1 SpoIIE family protein phosphatase [Streptomyces poriferorum]WLQ53606.1 SpoIIE family protein phosphatase [Streptomyces sp. Alt1]
MRTGWGDARREGVHRSPEGGLLDVLGVGAMVLDTEGRIVLWSPQAEALLGYAPAEALGRFAARVLVDEEHFELVLRLFTEVMRSGEAWAGVFPVRHKDGTSRLLEFRNMRLQDDRGHFYALGLAADGATLREVERDLALSVRLVDQSPIGLAVLDHDLRYLAANPALERMDGLSADGHLGRRVGEALPFLDSDAIAAAMREVLRSGVPQVSHEVVGRTPADPDTDRAWQVSLYRLDDSGGRVLGIAVSLIDVTDRYRAGAEVERARNRLALIADASVRIGTTLDLEQTARELAEVTVPELADVAAVDVLDSVLKGHPGLTEGPLLIQALAVVAARPNPVVEAADPPGHAAQYGADRLITRCVRTGRPVREPYLDAGILARIARDSRSAELLAEAGAHSYMAVPLIARGEVLGAIDLIRTDNPLPFTEDDELMACELAARAAVSIDNARLYRQQRETALTLQRSMLPRDHHDPVGLEVASRYQPAAARYEVGGDWFDVIGLRQGRTALVVGDVMGSGINAATTMGRLRTATQTLSRLGLQPAEVLGHLDEITADLDPPFATCVYAVYDPDAGWCRMSTAGHLPPVLIPRHGAPRLIDLPAGAPLGVGGVPFSDVTVPLGPGDRLVLYTDGLVETRDDDIDSRLDSLLRLLRDPDPSLEESCDRLLRELRAPADLDDVALLMARVRG